VVGNHAEPTHAFGRNRLTRENRQYTKNFSAMDQRLARKAADAFRSNPIWSSDPVRQRFGKFWFLERFSAKSDPADLSCAKCHSPK
jgi:hypothetical protein